MRIELRTQGGFAGHIRRPPLVLETERLEPDVAREVAELAAGLPPGGPPGRGADLMRYDVVVEDEQGQRTFTYFDPDVPTQVRALLRLARSGD
jgi:hypothetical protein